MVASDPEMEPVFTQLITELEAKYKQTEEMVRAGNAAPRQDIERYIWKTGRVVRLVVLPEKQVTKAREIFWSECKGLLKQCIVLEKFNVGVFTPDSVREDVIESNLLNMLQKLLKYTKQRRSGEIPAPKEVLTMERAQELADKSAKRKLEELEQQQAKWKKEDAEWWQQKWKENETSKTWDDVESDPEEPCPDKAKHGNCSYGRQCGFCHR